mgnify:CR=1 FL=1
MASKGWVKGKVIDLNIKHNMDGWRQRLEVSLASINFLKAEEKA